MKIHDVTILGLKYSQISENPEPKMGGDGECKDFQKGVCFRGTR